VPGLDLNKLTAIEEQPEDSDRKTGAQ
jgi:hypothetical protein